MVTVFTRRVIAYVLDFFVVSSVMWILSYLFFLIMNPADVHYAYQFFPIIASILIIVYFVACEKIKGATVGKALMYLQVRSRNGAYINWPQAIIRNLSKIFWIPIIFDWAIGKFLNQDRILAFITKTVVIDELK